MDAEKGTVVREGVESIVNPFDTYALEEAVRIREKLGEGQVVAVSMGPPQAEGALRECVSVGADEAVLVSDRAFAGSDTWATSYTLAEALKEVGFDLIICGKQAIDGDTAQVGPGIAVHLDLPQATYVRKIREIGDGKIVVERLIEEGVEVVEVPLPALLTVVKEINEPRLPSLKGKMRARKAEIRKLTQAELKLPAENIGTDGSPTRVVSIFSPPPREGGEMYEGEVDEVTDKLIAALEKEGLV